MPVFGKSKSCVIEKRSILVAPVGEKCVYAGRWRSWLQESESAKPRTTSDKARLVVKGPVVSVGCKT